MSNLSVIIVSWNTKDLLRKCIASIEAEAQRAKIETEIIVVDNASHDGTSDELQKSSKVILITNQTNKGFAAANNQGLKQAKGSHVLFLNPDTEIVPGNFTAAMQCLSRNQEIGIVGCQHRNTDGSMQPSVRTDPTHAFVWLTFLKIRKLVPRVSAIRNVLLPNFDYTSSQEVQQVAGSYMLAQRDFIASLGGFDEDFFLWFEEVDLCYRVRQHNKKIWYCADAQIIHHGGQSFSQELVWKKQKMFFKSARLYFKKRDTAT